VLEEVKEGAEGLAKVKMGLHKLWRAFSGNRESVDHSFRAAKIMISALSIFCSVHLQCAQTVSEPQFSVQIATIF
jgi:hypothetical protein